MPNSDPCSFIHDKDNNIRINGRMVSLRVFHTVAPEYSLPVGATARVYIKGRKHYIIFGKSNQRKQPIESVIIDGYISKLDSLELLRKSCSHDVMKFMIDEVNNKLHSDIHTLKETI